ncbi:MAG: hypothetical protein LKH04_04045 [Lachnospiraceae bacterium]|jgi:hypothetical protein|nr:hypothetical protein [Lachnospiraceae bacterium]MCI1397589.1 hypothetical protein [Lachnospiraceae bacterium]MCI1423461.1 hypothetical protein [Lachnospiraceae bacterium]MCI1451884.1 hypothetical protein [Lachnospiraceae bacterium]
MAYEEYKYVIDQMSSIEIGAKWTYDELIDNVDLSHKFRQVCRSLFEQEVDGGTTIESHLYYLEKDTESFRAYKKLKTKVTCMVPDMKRAPKEDGTPYFRQEVFPVEELVKVPAALKEQLGVRIQEIVISKVGLASLVV